MAFHRRYHAHMDTGEPQGDARQKAANARKRSAISDAIAATIRAERAVAGITKEDMAERSGISRSSYYRLETGDRPADVSQLAAIAATLGMPMHEVVRLAEERMARSEKPS